MTIFRIEYPTGYMELNVGNFFGTVDKKRLAKVLRLARDNCSERQRLELVESLAHEVSERKGAIEKLESHRREMQGILVCFHRNGDPLPKIEPSTYEKALSAQVKKLTEIIDILRKDAWQT